MPRDAFVSPSAAYSSTRPGSPSGPSTGLAPATDGADRASRSALAQVFRGATEDERLGVLRAHPDLAGKLAIAGD